METKLLGTSRRDIIEAASLLKAGEVVAVPTETVYGLAANAFDEAAVRKIFSAKMRPCDNPLIVHISSLDMLKMAAISLPRTAIACADAFWPGPLTMVLPKRREIPYVTSGGLETVGIRFPSDRICQSIISECGFPLAAPSANLSGSPSPTNAKRVYEDMNGRISAIVDGGESMVGLESTVISFEGDSVRILRPGRISYDDLLAVAKRVIIDSGVTQKVDSDKPAASPGMKYRHYAPKARVILIESDLEAFRSYVQKNRTEGSYCLLFSDGEAIEGMPYLTYGADGETQAHLLFERLRQFDELGAATIFARCPSQDGVGLAVYNRILRSSGFNIVKL